MNRVSKSKDDNVGFFKLGTIIILIIIVATIISGYILFHNSDQSNIGLSPNSTTQSTTTSHNSTSKVYSVLSPATVPSKVAECNQQITFGANGVSGPIKCSNGDLNTIEWNSLATLEPKVLSLGYSVNTNQVESALCADVHANISNPIEEINYQIASLYYGWNFSSDPSVVINNGTCVNTDD